MEWNINLPYSIVGNFFHTTPFHSIIEIFLSIFHSLTLTPCTNTSEDEQNGANPGLRGTLYKNNFKQGWGAGAGALEPSIFTGAGAGAFLNISSGAGATKYLSAPAPVLSIANFNTFLS